MDTMQLRRQGKPKNPMLMGLLMFVMRLCLIAHSAGKDAETLLGPNGHRLKRMFEVTGLRNLLIWCAFKNPSRVLGIGGQSIVIQSTSHPDYIEKYNYTLAGATPEILKSALAHQTEDQKYLENHFGNLAQPTVYAIGQLPLRWPFSRLTTTYARQPRLYDFSDIFSTNAREVINRRSQLLPAVDLLASQTRLWLSKNKWLDLVGPGNIVVTTDYGEPCIRIIDTGPYAAEYIDDVNPVLSRSYRDVFMERLLMIESRFSKILILMLGVGVMILGIVRFSMSPHHIYALLDAIEDRIFG